MGKVILVCGKICSGKSHYSRAIKESLNAVIISPDEATYELINNEQNDIFVMIKEKGNISSYIFINEYDELFAKWNGRKMFKEEVESLSCIENILYLKNRSFMLYSVLFW